MSENFPLVFRPTQIENFLIQAKEANRLPGPDGMEFSDSHIEMVLEEVEAKESDLSSARVSIAIYLESEINKDPDNPIFHRLRDLFRPIFNEVIQIEVKMFGAPKYQISFENNTASAWRMDAAAISDVTLPQDVLTEAAKYNFTNVSMADYELPEQPKTILDRRGEFYDPLPDEQPDGAAAEQAWLKDFEKEAAFELVDRALFVCNFHEQVSTLVTKDLMRYLLTGREDGFRTAEAMEYEGACDVPEPETVPGQYIITAANASKRALFTAFYITGSEHENFIEYLKNELAHLRKEMAYPADSFRGTAEVKGQNYEDSFVIDKGRTRAVNALIKMYAKHPIFAEDVSGLEIVFKFLHTNAPNMLSHFYACMNDMVSFFDERKFYESSANCTLLKDFITDLTPQKAEPSEEEVAQANDQAQEQRAASTSSGIYIEE